MRVSFVKSAVALLDENPDIAIVLADIGLDAFEEAGAPERHPNRIINVGIREQLMIGTAAGLALEGFTPIAFTYAPFLVERPFEQLKLDFSHQGVSGVFVSVGASRDAAGAGRSHQAPEDVALIATLPGWKVAVPGHPGEVDALLREAVTSPNPTYMRLSTEQNAHPTPLVSDGWGTVRQGGSGAPLVIAVGSMLDPVAEAVREIDVTLLYTVRPLEVDYLPGLAATCGEETIVVEPYLAGTTLSRLTSVLSDRPRRFLSLGFPAEEHRHYGTPSEHFAAAGLDTAGIAQSIREFLG